MRSVLFASVILLASGFPPARAASAVALRGGPGDLAPAELASLGLLEECPEEPGLARSEVPACRPDSATPFFAGDGVFGEIDAITGPGLGEIACVAAAQKTASEFANDPRTCAEKRKKPCRGLAAVSKAARALTLVSECVGVDRAELFRGVALEAGWFPTALPLLSAWTSSLPATMGKPFCSPLARLEKGLREDGDPSICERMATPDGDLLPLYLQAKARRALRSDLEASRRRFGVGTEELLRAVVFSASVVGELRARSVFQAALHSRFSDARDFLRIYRDQLGKTASPSERESLGRFEKRSADLEDGVKAKMRGRACF